MTFRFERTPFKVDIARLINEAHKLAWDEETGLYKSQVSIQNGGGEDWNEGTGSRPGESEKQWDKVHPSLVGTWWDTDFFPSLPWKVYRTRIMTMEGRKCYSIHKDDNPRLHVALKTTGQARFIFTKPAEIIHIPVDGHIWWVDTRHEHTAINGSIEPRIHLLMSLANNDSD